MFTPKISRDFISPNLGFWVLSFQRFGRLSFACVANIVVSSWPVGLYKLVSIAPV